MNNYWVLLFTFACSRYNQHSNIIVFFNLCSTAITLDTTNVLRNLPFGPSIFSLAFSGLAFSVSPHGALQAAVLIVELARGRSFEASWGGLVSTEGGDAGEVRRRPVLDRDWWAGDPRPPRTDSRRYAGMKSTVRLLQDW